MIFDEYDQYSENMLMSQYDISEIISHELTKGEVREDFLISTLGSCSDPQPKFVKGTVADDTDDAGQLDIILCRPHAHVRKMGMQAMVTKDDALCIIEVKGNCTGRDLNGAEAQAKKIRALKGTTEPLYGVICYRSELKERTLLDRFGYKFDRETHTYYDNATIPNEPPAEWHALSYPTLDFFASLEDGKKMFLRRYEPSPGVSRYTRDVTTPLIKHVFKLTRSLWIPAFNAQGSAASS